MGVQDALLSVKVAVHVHRRVQVHVLHVVDALVNALVVAKHVLVALVHVQTAAQMHVKVAVV